MRRLFYFYMETAEKTGKITFKDKLKKIFNLSFLLVVVFFILGLVIGRVWLINWFSNVNDGLIINETRVNGGFQNKFKLINPLLGCAVAPQKFVTEFIPLKNKLEQLINNKIASNEAKNISIYFDTRDGRWLGINQDQTYSPASLLKAPIMIAIFKMAESDPKILSKKILFEGDYNLNTEQNFKPAEVLEPYKYYTVEDLIERMIVYSDNNTLPLLVKIMDEKTFSAVYSDLGLGSGLPATKDYTPKSYSIFFRVLYNGTYLNKEMSEKALELLSKVDFTQGIRAGLPANMVVADKFGERDISDLTSNPENVKELHDCGIVYFPGHPYLLCIMTKGSDFDKLSTTIKDISSLVYGEMAAEIGK